MAYIGTKPTDAVLETDDIADGIVTNPKLSTGSQQNFRNIIINGDMSIAQRGTSTASITSTGYHTVDRFQTEISSFGTWTQSQSTDVPSGQGFAKSLKMDCTTADASPSASDFLVLAQKVEGQNLQYLKKGTSNAESVTLSFWVKSNKTGTYIAELYDSNNRQISKAYTINASSTWEKKSITFDGDTTGTLTNSNATGLFINFWLGAGSDRTSGTLNTSWNSVTTANRVVGQVNLADSTSNEWYITGVQLEAGTASDFEFLPVDVNLGRCERYYQVLADGTEHPTANLCTAGQYTSNGAYGVIRFLTIMRAAPTMEQVTGGDYYRFRSGATNYNGTLSLDISTPRSFRLNLERTQADIPANAGGWIGISGASTTAKVAVTSEL